MALTPGNSCLTSMRRRYVPAGAVFKPHGAFTMQCGARVLISAVSRPSCRLPHRCQHKKYAVEKMTLLDKLTTNTCETAYFRRADIAKTGRGDAVAATWIFRGDKSRRRRGCDVDMQWR